MPFFSTKRQIRKIIDALSKIAQGDFKEHLGIYPDSEITHLADTINKSLQKLKDKIYEKAKETTRMQTILNSMVEGVIAVDKDKKILSINPAITKIFDVSKQVAEGKFFLEVIRNNDIFELITEVLERGELVSREITLIFPVRKIFKVSASPIFDGQSLTGCVAVIYDITDMRRLETIRSEFVANASHELKTPLTSIKGFVETLLGGAIDDKENSRNFLRIIEEHTTRLGSLINDLLELSRIESKQVKLIIEEVNCKELVAKVITMFKSQLKKKNITITNDINAKIEINADREKIQRAFINLIDNAIKFNKESGYINIYNQDINGARKFIIEDSGIGIPAKDLPRIYERFYRVDKARSREFGGTGLGLSIVKHIIELHKGEVGVESTEGFGSKFWFTLPK
jgi:two-component system phosphate regulon sensor histidine kinase PhoR